MSALAQRMRPTRQTVKLCLTAFLFFLLGACQTPAPIPQPEMEPEAPIVKPKPSPKPVPKQPPPPPPPPPVAVILSRDIPAYSAVSSALESLLKEFSGDSPAPVVFSLDNIEAHSLLDLLSESNVQQVVAIGDNALDAVANMEAIDVVYAQVFTPQASHRGVPAIPPAKGQLAYWQTVDGSLKRIGVLGSEPFRATIEEIEGAGNELNMSIQHSIVSNDQQAWLEFRRLLPEIDGFIILPDQNILSPGVIQRMLSHGKKNNVRFLTYNALLFKLGANLHITQNPEDVATQITDLLKNVDQRERPLTVFRARTQGSEVFVDING